MARTKQVSRKRHGTRHGEYGGKRLREVTDAELREAIANSQPSEEEVLRCREEMQLIWQEIETVTTSGELASGAVLPQLAPPATEESLLKLEEELGFPLPTDIREFYKIHNGEKWAMEKPWNEEAPSESRVVPGAHSDGVLGHGLGLLPHMNDLDDSWLHRFIWEKENASSSEEEEEAHSDNDEWAPRMAAMQLIDNNEQMFEIPVDESVRDRFRIVGLHTFAHSPGCGQSSLLVLLDKAHTELVSEVVSWNDEDSIEAVYPLGCAVPKDSWVVHGRVLCTASPSRHRFTDWLRAFLQGCADGTALEQVNDQYPCRLFHSFGGRQGRMVKSAATP